MTPDLCTEYDDRSTVEIEQDVFRELEWLRFYEATRRGLARKVPRKPGWAGFLFRAWFGHWPPDWMLTLTPTPAGPKVLRLVRRRDNAFKKEMRERERDARAAVSGGVETAAGQNGHAGGVGKVEGGFDLADMAGGGYYAGNRRTAVRRQGARQRGRDVHRGGEEVEGDRVVAGTNAGPAAPA